MQVKKFEAPTIKEALEMVKNQLGPEAIILNAKDNSRGFGLVGKKSIEITAAISERQLMKKQIAESKLRDAELEKLRRKPARLQKEFIEKSVEKYIKAQEPEQEEIKKRKPFTKMRYIDIEDEEEAASAEVRSQTGGRTVDELLQELGQQDKAFVDAREHSSSAQRVRSAAQNALRAFQDSEVPTQTYTATKIKKKAVSNDVSLNEVQILKNEILSLKSMIQNLKQVSVTQIPVAQVAKAQDIELHPGAEKGIGFELSHVYQKLMQSGVSEGNTLALIESAKKDLKDMSSRSSLVEGWIAKHMLTEIQVANKDEAAPLQIFFGPSGSGKSSHLVKLASYYVIHKNKKVGILTCDTDKVGAVDQLRIYAQILNVPFGILRKQEDWTTVLNSLNNLDYVLVDFPGLPLKELDQHEKLKNLLPSEKIPCGRHLVLSATLKDKDAFELTERYRMAKPTDVIFNKLDEAITHGLIYNFQKKFNLPLFTFGIGSQLPEDMEFATKERLVDLIFKISKLKAG